jgi:hypothetical protein
MTLTLNTNKFSEKLTKILQNPYQYLTPEEVNLTSSLDSLDLKDLETIDPKKINPQLITLIKNIIALELEPEIEEEK